MDELRAGDLTCEHVGQCVCVEGDEGHVVDEEVEGVVWGIRRFGGRSVDVVLDRDPYVVNVPDDRPVTVSPPVECPPV